MDEQRQYDQQEPIYNSFVLIFDVASEIYREQWTITTSGERASERLVPEARQDDEEDIYIYIYIYIYI